MFYSKSSVAQQAADARMHVKVGGRMHWDIAAPIQSISADSVFGEADSRIFPRRLRLSLSGGYFEKINFKLKIDLHASEITFNDVAIEITDFVGNSDIVIGYFREPIGLDILTSSNSIIFLERNLSASIIEIRNTGLMWQSDFLNKRLYLAAGAFAFSNNRGFAPSISRNHSLTGRIVALPILNEQQNRIFHLGYGYSLRRYNDFNYDVNTRPATKVGNVKFHWLDYQKTSVVQWHATETAVAIKSLYIQAEYVSAMVDNLAKQPDGQVESYNLSTSMIFGGRRKIDFSNYSFLEIEVQNPLLVERRKRNSEREAESDLTSGGKGLGALEIGLRYSNIYHSHSEFSANRLHTYTFGLTWYINNKNRWMFNYVLADEAETGISHYLQTRFQIAF